MEESAYLKFVRIELHSFLKQARDVLRHDACTAVPHRHGHMTCVCVCVCVCVREKEREQKREGDVN
jgi:hypothetical protein